MPIKKLFNMKFWGSLYTQKVTFGSFHDSVMTRIDWALLFAGHIRPFLCNSLCTCVCLSFHTAHITCPTCVWILMCTAADCFLKFKLPYDGYRVVINVLLCLAGTVFGLQMGTEHISTIRLAKESICFILQYLFSAVAPTTNRGSQIVGHNILFLATSVYMILAKSAVAITCAVIQGIQSMRQ